MKSIQPLLAHRDSLFAILWTLVILILSLITIHSEAVNIPIEGKDKVVHFAFYFMFVFLWSKAFNYKKTVIILCIAIGYGIIIEVLQHVATTTRQFDYFDIIANVLGALTGFFVISKKKISLNN